MRGIARVGFTLALAASCAWAAVVWAQEDTSGRPGAGPRRHGPHHAMHAEMREQMRAHDARLEELVAAMNEAEGSAKVDAIAAVVNELVAQRRTMRAHHDEMWEMRRRKKTDEGKAGSDEP